MASRIFQDSALINNNENQAITSKNAFATPAKSAFQDVTNKGSIFGSAKPSFRKANVYLDPVEKSAENKNEKTMKQFSRIEEDCAFYMEIPHKCRS